jgi:hypothetical protein
MRLKFLDTRNGVVYEYDSDLPGTTGRLCPSTAQVVRVTDASGMVGAGAMKLSPGEVLVVKSPEEAEKVNQSAAGSRAAVIAIDRVDWETEVLVGVSVMADPSVSPVPARAEWDPERNVVRVTLSAKAGEGNKREPVTVWLAVERSKAGAAFDFAVADPAADEGAPLSPAATPGRLF